MALAVDAGPVWEDEGAEPPPPDPATDPSRRPSPEALVSFLVVAGAVIFTFAQLQPSLLLANTTPAGGDMGAHVWAPDFVRRVLLPQGRLTGWAPDWYAGFPALTFYFPLPTLMIIALDVVLPYGIAFKLVTAAGMLSLPVAAWALGRLSRMPFPGPALLAVASVVFLFDRGFTIYGGNIASTLAGEFSFSISLSLALVFLGLVARGLDTGPRRALAAGVLALTGLSHLLPTIFAVAGAGLFVLLRPGGRRLRATVAVLGVGAVLAAFWSLPFLIRLPYANDMGWQKLVDYKAQLFPEKLRWLPYFALVGAAFSIARLRRLGLFFVGMAALSVAVFRFAPQGRLWNARALPFWFLCLYFLAALAVAELGPALARGLARNMDRPGLLARLATPLAAALAVWLFVGQPLGVVPSWVPVPKAAETSFVPGWARWNYSGYERKDAYPEYRSVIDAMAEVGRSRGCGRAHWEYEEEQNRFGTPMALMLLPYWTQGCIGSMEGLYFESSATTPFHFLNAGELSARPSNPQRDLPYVSNRPDLEAGVRHLQIMGVRYYLAFSPEAVAAADVHPDLSLVASTGQWRIYEVAGSALVEALDYEPAVMKGVAKGGRQWLDASVAWYTSTEPKDVFLAADGPDTWSRVAVPSRPDVTPVGSGVVLPSPPRRALPEVSVTNIRTGRDGDMSFDVSRIGTPVLVKASYFPNWRARGAEGPWRVAPNLMVVVPTERHVTLRYAWTPVEVFGWALTALGLGICATWVRRRRRRGSVTDDPGTDDAGTDDAGTDDAGTDDAGGTGLVGDAPGTEHRAPEKGTTDRVPATDHVPATLGVAHEEPGNERLVNDKPVNERLITEQLVTEEPARPAPGS